MYEGMSAGANKSGRGAGVGFFGYGVLVMSGSITLSSLDRIGCRSRELARAATT
jgi:hypothetical protein